MLLLYIIERLKTTISRNKKLAILTEYKNNSLLKEFLFYTYNPYYRYYLKKLPYPEYFGHRNPEQSWGDFKILLDKLKNRQITGHRAFLEVKQFFSTITKETYNLYRQVFKKKLTGVGINVKTINKVFKGLIPEFKIQLANEFNIEKIHKYPEYWYVSPKLNGIRAIYLHGKSGLYTRQGHKIIGFDFIEQDCFRMCNKLNLNFLDGELYSDRIDFNTIQSCVMNQKNFTKDIKQQIKYNLFALGACNTTSDMINKLKQVEKISGFNSFIKVLPYIKVKNDINEIIKMYLMLYNEYEGIVLRHPEVYYDWKRSDKLLKFKRFTLLEIYEKHRDTIDDTLFSRVKQYLDTTKLVLDDFFIVDVIEGQGEFKGMLGALVIEGNYRGNKIITKVGSGFDKKQRMELWNMQDNLLGKEVVVKCEEITKDNSLKFPVIKEIKLDR